MTDGSALFLSFKFLEATKPLDYRRLEELLKEQLRLKSFDLSIFFTAFDPANEGQLKFLGFIRDVMKWSVEAAPISEAIVTPPTVTTIEANQSRPYIRFDARIAFCLGRLAGLYNVAVISDSYGICSPILETVKRDSKVTLAYFGQLLDPRWGKNLREASSPITWIDLDRYLEDLLGAESRMKLADVSAAGLSRLP